VGILINMAIKSKKVTNKSSLISKKTLSDRISEKIGKRNNLAKSQIEAVLGEYLEETKQALIKGEEIRLPGYYSLKTVTQKPRVAMNLQTKKKMTIPAKRVPKVKFSAELKKEIAKKK
jgi:DNA-binding protein HU-beta